jgi:outer membrane protein assembly factor BamB
MLKDHHRSHRSRVGTGAGRPRVRWTFETQQYAQALTATDDAVYVVDDRTLYALDAGTGTQRWTALSSTGPDFGFARHALRVMGSVVVADFNGVVTAVDAATGAVSWSLPDLTTTFDDAVERVGITAATAWYPR